MRLINSQRAGGDALPAAARLQPCTARHARARPAPADQDACALPPAAPPAAPAAPLRRRAALALLAAAAAARSFPARAASARVPPPPPELGEAGGTLNDCDDNRISCASSMSDDERFFYNPWEYSGPRDAAVERLVSVATGGYYDPGLARDALNGSVGISRGDAAAFIVGATLTTIAGRPPPARPEATRAAEFRAFDGRLMDTHVTEDGSIYVWVAFGLPEGYGDDDDSSSSSSSSDDDDNDDDNKARRGAPASGAAAAAPAAAAPAAAAPAAARGGGAAGGQEGAGAEAGTAAGGEGEDEDSSSSSSSSSDEEAEGQEAGGTDAATEAGASGSGGGGGGSSSGSGAAGPSGAAAAEAAAPAVSGAGAAKGAAKGGEEGGREGGGGGGQTVDPSSIIDAEFIFPLNDAIVNVRAASRAEPGLARGRLALSFERGLVLERNKARQQLEALRKALRWEIVPVMSADDPKYNNERPLFFERFYEPFMQRRGSGGGGGGQQPY